MDFSQVKQLFIPQGEVTKITNLEGITLWQKISRILKEWRGLSPLTCAPTVANNFEEVRVYGNSVQDGTPTPTAPIEVESVGDYDDTTGKYKVPVTISGITTNIYLDQPLRKIGEYADTLSVDGTNVTVVRNIGILQGKYWNNESPKVWKKSTIGINRYYYSSAINREIKEKQMFLCNVGYINIRDYNNSIVGAMGNTTSTGLSIVMPYNIDSVDLVKQFMIDNAIIYYPLNTPTTETYTIDSPIMALDNTTIIDVETKVSPSEVYASEWVEE